MANKRKSSNNRKKTNKPNDFNQEIKGVIYFFVSVFLGFVCYSEKLGIIGEFLGNLAFGLLGIFAYIIPVLIFGISIILVFGLKKQDISNLSGYIIVCVLSLVSIIHAFSIKNLDADYSFFAFVKQSFDYGKDMSRGGGAIGSLLFYPINRYMGIVGCYIIFTMVFMVTFMIITNLSIKAFAHNVVVTSKKVNTAVKEKREYNKQKKQRDLFVLGEADEPYISSGNKRDKPVKEVNSIFKQKKLADLDEENKNIVIKGEEQVERKIELENFDNKKRSNKKKSSSKRPAGKSADMPQINISEYNKNVEASKMPVETLVEKPEEKFVENENIDNNIPEFDRKSKNNDDDKIYVKPPYALLKYVPPTTADIESNAHLRNLARKLEETLKNFKLEVKVVNICKGPVVTRFEVVPAAGVRVSRIVGLSDDIALNLAAQSIRIEAPIPGKSAVGIEIPNKKSTSVYLKELVDSSEFRSTSSFLSFCLGKDIAGKNIFADIAKMPHLLIAGATGSGKSVCVNSIIMSILYNSSPQDVKMIMVDPKVVELSVFDNIPHLLTPVVTDPKKAASALNWATIEMQRRYNLMGDKGIRTISSYNDLAFNDGFEKLPHILIIIDELSDLMMTCANDVEDSICRIAQLGRACGIHLVIATQRPTVNVITGTIKANVPSRIAFAVSSALDSRTILDCGGAEKLLGKGDMLYYPTGVDTPIRVQGCFVSEKEVNSVVDFLKTDTETFDEAVVTEIENLTEEPEEVKSELSKVDKMLPQAVEVVIEHNQASISMLQRRLRVGYARAARLIDEMEIRNIVAKSEGPKPREVLISYSQYKEMFGKVDNE